MLSIGTEFPLGTTDLRTIQLLMGHERLEEDTTVYLHLSQTHLHAAVNPLDLLTIGEQPQQGEVHKG